MIFCGSLRPSRETRCPVEARNRDPVPLDSQTSLNPRRQRSLNGGAWGKAQTRREVLYPFPDIA